MSDEEKKAEGAAEDVAKKAEDAAKEAVSEVEDAAKDAAAKVEDVAKDAAAKVEDTAKAAAASVQKPQSEMTKEEKKAAKKAAAKANGHKKAKIVWGVIIVVVVVAGIGFSVWHSKPTFCNAICHQPMDSYVEGYYSGDSDLLVTAHAKADVTCLDCHVPTMSQQVSEAFSWMGKKYELVDSTELAGVTTSTEVLAQRRTFASYTGSSSFCLKDGCHTTDQMDVVDTLYSDYPPHNNHNTKLDCYNCHRVHGQSVMYCTKCHTDATVPDGWLTYDEGQTADSRELFTEES